MELKFVKTTKCPVCGCDIVVRESVETDYNNTAIRQHCNGGLWEHREFLCGYIASYVPNFYAEHTHESTMMRCRNNPKVIELNKKREALKQQIQATIKTADCDEDFKRRLASVYT